MDNQQFSLREIYRKGDRIMVGVLWFMFLVSLGIAGKYDTWAEAFAIGLSTALMGTLMMFVAPTRRLTRMVIGAAFMVFSALLIHQMHGLIEMHFGIFVLLAFLLYYRDWLPIVTAAAVIAVHHLAFNYLQASGAPVYVFSYGTGFNIVLLHAAFVVFESVLLVYMAVMSYREGVQSQEIHEIGSHLVMRDGRIDLTYFKENAQSDFAIGFNEFIGALKESVGKVQEAVTIVNNGASEIAAGNLNLSQRTEEQAASIEETAASMEEMTASVRQNSESAKQAADLADKAYNEATRGGSVAAGAVTAMSNLSESSQKIADITGVIDGIAFQTNLLALNAAVEAARAGEQGRGFAVVASEVRSLAQRSSEAAKEIKGLIETSVGQVRTTSELVDSTGEALSAIVSSVKKAADIVMEITAASLEQSSNIEQVNHTIAQLDDMTQKNAALVEEASSASKSMEDQAGVLASMVSRFDTDADTAKIGIKVPERIARGGTQPSRRKLMSPDRRTSDWETF